MTIFQNIIDVTTIEKEQPDNTTSKQKIGQMAIGRMAIGKEEPGAALLKGTVSTSNAKPFIPRVGFYTFATKARASLVSLNILDGTKDKPDDVLNLKTDRPLVGT